jgi:type VI secretion system protein ImpA
MLAPQPMTHDENVEALLEPISASPPCGDDLLFSADFDFIQDARRFDDPSLDQGEWVTDVKEADWSAVEVRCTVLLQTRTKDLRLAVWLTEALAMRAGLSGLTRGYTVLSGLVERYWSHVHPLSDGDDIEHRLGNVSWLSGRTAELLRAIPLTQSGMAFSALDWDIATHAAQAAKRDPENAHDILRGKPAVEQIDASKRATPADFYRELLTQFKAFETALNVLDQTLTTKAGDAAPSFRQARSAYESVYSLAERFARDVGVDPQAEANAMVAAEPAQVQRMEPSFKSPPGAEGHEMNDAAAVRVLNRPSQVTPMSINSRADAVNQLRKVAAFFRETEPHSPAAYLADKAAEWAEMPLHQWLSVVVKDDGALAHVRELLGVKA